MRRFAKMIPQEISLTQEGANRRVIATFKSRTKPEEDVAKGGPGRGPQKGDGNGEGSGNHDNAARLHDEAQKASIRADKSKDGDDHAQAAGAHYRAAEAYRDLGSTSGMVQDRADYHKSEADHHAKVAGIPLRKNRGPTSITEAGNMDIREAIQNTPEHIVGALDDVTKSRTATGRQFTPQAASVSKAIGRMAAPFSDELTMADWIAIGKAAGLGEDDEPTVKSVGKGDPEEDDTDAESADQGRGLAPKAMDFDADDAEEDALEDDEGEDDEPEEGLEPEDAKVRKSAQMENVALKAKKDDTEPAAEAESEPIDAEDDEAGKDSKPTKAEAWGQPKGVKAKGETVAKSATSGSPAPDEQYSEIRKSLERQRQENEQLREAIAKTRKDLDEERGYRALESIKKSVREDYGHLNVDVDALAPVLKSLKESTDQAMYEQLTATLKAANAQVKAAQDTGGLFQSVGKSSARSAAAGAGASWADKIEARVEEEFKKNAKGRVRAQVYDQFVSTDEGREMLANHRAEMAQTRGF